MEYHRGELKRSVKSIIRQTKPSPWRVSFLFLLVASVIPTVIKLILNFGSTAALNIDILQRMIDTGNPEMVSAYLSSIQGNSVGFDTLISVFVWLFVMVMTFGYQWYCLKMVRRQEANYNDMFNGFSQAGWVILLYLLIMVFTILWTVLFCIAASVVIGICAAIFYETSTALFVVLTVAVCMGVIALEIMISLRYVMAPFVYMDEPEAGVVEAIRKSKLMMQGQKARLFVLELSFIGWYLLVGLVFVAVIVIGIAIAGTAISTSNMTVALVVVSVAFVLAFLLSLPLQMWLQPYVTGSTAQFYNLMPKPVNPVMPESSFWGQLNGNEPPQDSNSRRPLSDYEPKVGGSSTPGYDPDRNAPKQDPDPTQPEGKPQDDQSAQ